MSIHAAGFSDRKVPSAVDDWTAAAGRHVAIYRNGVQVDRGQVEAITADGKILWLMQDGAQYRRIVEKVPGIELCFLEEAGPALLCIEGWAGVPASKAALLPEP
jgi:hypothetical protein